MKYIFDPYEKSSYFNINNTSYSMALATILYIPRIISQYRVRFRRPLMLPLPLIQTRIVKLTSFSMLTRAIAPVTVIARILQLTGLFIPLFITYPIYHMYSSSWWLKLMIFTIEMSGPTFIKLY
jgi:hypothetical protein